MEANSCTESLPDLIAAPEVPAAILRGTARGLEVIVDGSASVAAIVSDVMKRLDEAPAFFRGSDVRIRVEDGPLPAGCLARLDEIMAMFELRIVEVTASKRSTSLPANDPDRVPEVNLASGSAPFEDESPTHANAKPLGLRPALAPGLTDVDMPAAIEPTLLDVLADLEATVGDDSPSFDEPTQTAAPLQLAATPEIPLEPTTGTRIVVGPVRSGVILEHFGNLIIFGDVNPGAEVRATGNIVVLGRLRGTAHAGIGQEVGFILALHMEPQQLRIGRKVARSAPDDIPSSVPEIAYGTGDSVVVERYLGKLPRNLATSL
jgi:septum formation inhibitor MinC